MNDTLISKIKKLLELGTSSNPHEAELALMKARELALRENIDLAAIELFKDTKAEPIDKNEVSSGNRFSVCQKFCNWILVNHFNVRVILTGSRYSGRSITLVGKKTDLEIAKYVNGFLNQEFMRLWHKYRAETNVRTQERGSFLYGCYRGLDEKLLETKRAAEQDELGKVAAKMDKQIEEVKSKYALMVISQGDRLKEATNKFFPKLTHSRTTIRVGSSSSLEAGRIVGRNISLNRAISSNQKTLT